MVGIRTQCMRNSKGAMMNKVRRTAGLTTSQGVTCRDFTGDGWSNSFWPTLLQQPKAEPQFAIAYEATDPTLAKKRKKLISERQRLRSLVRARYQKALARWRVEVRTWKDSLLRRLTQDVENHRITYWWAEIRLHNYFRSANSPLLGGTLTTMVNRNHQRRLFELTGEVRITSRVIQSWLGVSKFKIGHFGLDRRVRADEYPITYRGAEKRIFEALGAHMDSSTDLVVGAVRYARRVRRLTAAEAKRLLRDAKRLRYSKRLVDSIHVGPWGAPRRPSIEILCAEEMKRIREIEGEVNALVQFHRCCHIKRIPADSTASSSVRVRLTGCNPAEVIPVSQVNVGYQGELPFHAIDGIAVPNPASPLWSAEAWFHSSSGQRLLPLRTILGDNPLMEHSIPINLETSTTSVLLSRSPVSGGIKMLDPNRENFIATEVARQATRLEGLVFGNSSPDRLARSVAELKDAKQTITSAPGFLAFVARYGRGVGRGSLYQGGKLLRTFHTVRSAAQCYLWWKFGIEPTVHDINGLLEDVRAYLRPMRAGLLRMYKQWFDLLQPFTFKIRRKWSDDASLPVPETPDEEWETEVFLPLLPLSKSGLLQYYSTSVGDLFGPIVTLPDGTSVPNGTALLQGLGDYTGYDVDQRRLYDLLTGEISLGASSFFYWYTTSTLVFSRFNASEVKRAVIGAESFLSGLFESGHALSTSWELLPLSFIADWFLSTREVVENAEVKAFLATEGLNLRSLFGPWVGQHITCFQAGWETEVSITRARAGTFETFREEHSDSLPTWAEGLTWGLRSSSYYMPILGRRGVGAQLPLDRFPHHFQWLRSTEDFYPQWFTGYQAETLDAFCVPLLRLTVRARANPVRVEPQSTTRLYRRFPLDPDFLGIGNIPTYKGSLLGRDKLLSLGAMLVSSLPSPKNHTQVHAPGMMVR